jgi:hypothetical protein
LSPPIISAKFTLLLCRLIGPALGVNTPADAAPLPLPAASVGRPAPPPEPDAGVEVPLGKPEIPFGVELGKMDMGGSFQPPLPFGTPLPPPPPPPPGAEMVEEADKARLLWLLTLRRRPRWLARPPRGGLEPVRIESSSIFVLAGRGIGTVKLEDMPLPLDSAYIALPCPFPPTGKPSIDVLRESAPKSNPFEFMRGEGGCEPYPDAEGEYELEVPSAWC